MLTAREVLLQFYSSNGATVEFDDLDDQLVNHVFVVFSQHDWEEMGKPDEITVTIRAGDKLNESN